MVTDTRFKNFQQFVNEQNENQSFLSFIEIRFSEYWFSSTPLYILDMYATGGFDPTRFQVN